VRRSNTALATAAADAFNGTAVAERTIPAKSVNGGGGGGGGELYTRHIVCDIVAGDTERCEVSVIDITVRCRKCITEAGRWGRNGCKVNTVSVVNEKRCVYSASVFQISKSECSYTYRTIA
jgi:hypothetical protein